MQRSPVGLLASLLVTLCMLGCSQPEGGNAKEEPPEQWPELVATSDIEGTTFVPTLDTPVDGLNNAIWCATFQVAWDHACDDVIGGPLEIENAEEVAERLNHSPVKEDVLPPNSFYATAGTTKDGIVETIRTEMAKRFPNVQPPTFSTPETTSENVMIAYAYLNTAAKFTTPFEAKDYSCSFTDASGKEHPVQGFGPYKGSDWAVTNRQLAQVKVLFKDRPEDSKFGELTAFALDLTADQPDVQVVVAVLPHADNLQAMLDDLNGRIANYKGDGKIGSGAAMMVPNVLFSLAHDFTELEGPHKPIQNTGEFEGGYIAKAWQSIRFRLDESGAMVVSEAKIEAAAAAPADRVAPDRFVVDRPFLVLMKRRDSAEPFFAAWMANADLLEAFKKSE
ncbi:hypothetical protein [Aeoliella sp. SH292]|uniref:hypothetical protein n=1 Tax=Aeoliella sp. SH292 TaxID=3454464 RepID=UPI003F9B4122